MARTEGRPLREGFTTGTAATAAALAALSLLLQGSAPVSVPTPLPPIAEGPRAWLDVPVLACAPGPAPELAGQPQLCPAGAPAAYARVRKDGGDDPDATNGALITASVVLQPEAPAPRIRIEGGPGVGRVTLPGLPVPVGEAAINPGPQAQLRYALTHALSQLAGEGPALTVVISVPGGEELARHTLNPRLGIQGGISILGTQGTVRPYSHTAWRATVAQGLSVARATGCRTVCLSTGRRSEVLLMHRYPELPEQAFIQAADFARFSLAEAGRLPLERLVWGCFFGKLAKLAQGLEYTHAREAPLDMGALAALCAEAGAACAPQVARCVTAAHALELLLADPARDAALAAVGARAIATARRFAGRAVTLHLFHTDGRELLTL
ncbi:MAG: cobalt-precorrin-5B (C(1))-methyltransferase [Desulfovibrio sp.]|uniref:cobalt-precorrin-5B (C(1))-methyltransferase CbiD n=1 Tax=Desulfovibrio sp. TaxID=885 RepID=UPI001A6AEEE0|nr:cobalt-precorrin-5B (C(1))-methyltransferase CbiD [Desulfovibrio sp.]MBD5416617.1 cobalt-precorrin-5B (C(1))-methyltransferase [Desulfovibrio sp.]